MSDQSQQSTLEQFGYKQELNRVLTSKDLIIYGLVIMVPIAPMGIYGIVHSASNGMAALAYLIGAIAMLFTALSYARMSEAFPIAGSVFAYASRGINKTVGFFAGWAILLDYAFIPALLYLLSAVALHDMMPQIPVYAWALAFIVINTLINIRGVELAAKFNKILLVGQLIVLAYFIICGVIGIANGINGSHFSLNTLFDAKIPLSAVVPGVAICVLSYLGFDSISTLAEETMGGNKTVGRATIIALVISGIIFVVTCWVAGMIYPNWQAFVNSGANLHTLFYEAAYSVGGNALKYTCEIAIIIALGFACSLSFQTAVARVLFSMSRDGLMPKAFSKVHSKYKTPYVATLFVGAIGVAICLIFNENIATLSCLVNFGALVSFMLLHISVVNYFVLRTKKYNFFQHILFPVVGFIIIAWIWMALAPISKMIGLGWMALGVIYFLILTLVLKRDTSKFVNLDL